MICRPGNSPHSGQDIDAMVCWFNERALSMSTTYAIKHTTAPFERPLPAFVTGSIPSLCIETKPRNT